MEETTNIPMDDTYTTHVSDSMELRNQLRSGLVIAQQKDTAKVPLYVSWPAWLDDGILCLYVKDFKEIVSNAIQDAARAVMTGEDADDAVDDALSKVVGNAADGFQALDVGGLQHMEPTSAPTSAPAPAQKPEPTQEPPPLTGFENDGIPEGLM